MCLRYNALAPVHRWIAERDTNETNGDHGDCAANEEVGRDGEEAPRFAETTQVGKDEQEECAERKFNTKRYELREGRGDRRNSSGGAHRSGEDVVNDKARCRYKCRRGAECAGGNRVGATPLREAEADLAVADGHNAKQETNREGDDGAEGEVGGAR